MFSREAFRNSCSVCLHAVPSAAQRPLPDSISLAAGSPCNPRSDTMLSSHTAHFATLCIPCAAVACAHWRRYSHERRPPAGAMAFAPFWIPETCARFSVDPKLWINEPTAHVPSLSNPIKIICYGIVRPFWGCKYPPIRKFPLLYFCIVRYATPFHFDKEFHRFVFENHDFLHHAF